jgi:hypothetical protein
MTTNNGRVLDDGRRAQGFTSQAELDLFYAQLDHKLACAVCSSVGGAVELSDGLQPFLDECAEGRRLTAAWFHFAADAAVAS